MWVTETDNDAVPTSVSLSVNPATVAENARATAVAVTATLNSGAFTIPTTLTVSVGAAGDGATEGGQDKSSKVENLFLLRENGRLIWRKAWVSSSSAF